MLENAMPGEAFLSNGVAAAETLKAASQNAAPNKTLRDMAEKLEKSEAGRKKLRQAISMLKEKVEANEKVLQVNEILRQECEKERLRAEAERNRAEEEKNLREQVEKEGLSTKEQLIRVLQRLDAVERDCKTDRNDIHRMRKEMKEAISGLGGAVKAIEAAHSSFQGLEKSLLGKVSNAVSASTKSTSLAESAISDAKGAQGTAVAAEKLSQTLVSRVAVLQNQGASLDQRVNLLQQEIRMRQLEPLDNELKSNCNRAATGIPLAAEKHSAKGMVLSKNQQQGGPLNPKLTIAEVSEVNIVKPGDGDSEGKRASLSQNTRYEPDAAGITSVNALPDSYAKDVAFSAVSDAPMVVKATDVKSIPDASRGNTVREALEAAKEKRKLSRSTSSKVVSLPGKPSSCQRSTLGTLTSNATHASENYLVKGEKFRGRVQADADNGSMPAVLQNEKINDSHRCVPVPHRTASNRGSNAEDSLAGRTVTYGHKGEKPPLALLKDITKLFLKEKKSHAKVEQKLAALQRVLRNSGDDEIAAQGLVESSVEKNRKRKRKRRESLKDNSQKKRAFLHVNSKKNDLVATPGDGVTGKAALGAVQGGAIKWKRNNFSSEGGSTVPLQSRVIKPSHSGPRDIVNDVSEAGWKCLQNSEDLDSSRFGIEREHATPANGAYDRLATATPKAMAPRQGIDTEVENLTRNGLNKGWDSDSETSEDDFGEDWWTAKRVLLSPSLPEVQPPSLLLKEPDSNAPLPWPAASDMNLEDISLFLDVLPPIDQEVSDKDRTAATLTNTADTKFETEDVCTKPGIAALSEEQSKDQHQIYPTETLSDLQTCSDRPSSTNFVQCFDNGTEPLNMFGDCGEDEKKDSLNDEFSRCSSFMSSGSRLESSRLLPQDVHDIPHGKSESLDDRLAADPGAIRDALADSQGAVKEEKLDVQRCAEMELVEDLPPYLELVVGGSAYESWVNSAASPVQQGPLTTTTDVSDKILVVFRRTRKLLHGALNNTNDKAIGSSVAVAADIVSIFRSSALSREDLMCTFTASLVDSHAAWDNEKTASCLSSECNSLQLLVEISKQVLGTEVFQIFLPQEAAFLPFSIQLQNFLIQGNIEPDCCQPTPKKVPIPKKVFAEGRSLEHLFHFTPLCSKLKRMNALISGGKLLATFCETIGKLDFLRNSIYLLLRFCDLDSECLLATISSFACVGCKNLFSVDNDDVVGRAVQVVLSELMHDAEVGKQTEHSPAMIEEAIECQSDKQQGPSKGAGECLNFTELIPNLEALKELIGKEDGLTFEGFLPSLVDSFHRVITTSLGSHLLDNRHLCQKSLRMITCDQDEPANLITATIPEGIEKAFETCPTTDVACSVSNGSALRNNEKYDDRSPLEDYCWRYAKATSSIQSSNQSHRDANLVAEWEQKFCDITNAVELVASHLGWEWTFNDFIVEHLWKLVSPGASAVTVACVVHMFGLLGRLGREVDNTELPGVDELRKSLLVVLNSDQTSSTSSEDSDGFSFRAQVAAAQSLLVLSSLNRKDEIFPSNFPERVFSKSSELHAKSVKCLWNWVKTSKPVIQEILPLSLRTALLSIDKSNFVPIF